MAQDSLARHKFLSISYNIVQTCINEAEVRIEYTINKRISVGASSGRIFYNREFDPYFLSSSQDKWPGTVYTGYSIRAYSKYYSRERPQNYWCLQAVYKNMSYGFHEFTDQFKPGEEMDVYTRSETAFLSGFDIIHGHDIEMEKVFKNWIWDNPESGRYITFDIFYGIGTRERTRNYTTYTSLDSEFPSILPVPIGTFKLKQSYTVIDFGICMGFNFLKKRPTVPNAY